MAMRRISPRAAAAAALLAAAVAVPVFAIEVSEMSIQRLAQPFMGGTGAPPLSPADTVELDHLGIRNGRYDLGDLRLFLYNNPQLIPEEQVVLP